MNFLPSTASSIVSGADPFASFKKPIKPIAITTNNSIDTGVGTTMQPASINTALPKGIPEPQLQPTMANQSGFEGNVYQKPEVGKDQYGQNQSDTFDPNTVLQGLANTAEKVKISAQEGVSNASNFVGYRSLGEKVKEKFPGAYDNIDPALLGKKTVEKHPEYQKYVDDQNNTPFMDHPIASTIGAIGKGLTSAIGTTAEGVNQASTAPQQSDFATASSQFGKGLMNAGLGASQIATSGTPEGLALNTAFSTDTAGKILKPVNDIMGQGISNIQGGLGFDPNSEASKNVREMGQTAATMGALHLAHAGVNKGIEKATPYIEPIATKAGEIVSNIGEKVSNIPNPMPKASKAVQDVYSNIATGMKKSEVEGIKNNPYSAEDIKNLDSAVKEGKVDDIKNYVNDAHETNANTVMSTIDAMKDGKGEFGKVYQEIDNTNATVPIATVLHNLQESLKSQIDFQDGVATRRSGSESKTINDSDIAKINGVIEDMRADAMRNNGVLTPEQVRTVRSTMSKYSKYDKTDSQSLTYDGSQLMQNMRKSIDNTAKDHIPGLREADAIYHDKIQAIEDAMKDLVYKGGDTKGDYRSNIVSIISNLDKKNRSLLANRLEEVMPGITKKVESINNLPAVYKAVTQMPKQAGVIGGAITGGSIGTATIPIPIIGTAIGAIIGAIVGATGESMITSGRMKNIIKEVSKDSSIKTAEIVKTAEKIKNNEALDAKANEILEIIRNKIKESESVVEGKKSQAMPESTIPGAKKTTVEVPSNPKGNQSTRLPNNQGVMVEPKGETKLLPSGDRMRQEEVQKVEKELNTALLSKYNPNKPQATKEFIDRNITQGKITREDAIGMVEKLYENANGFEKPHYEKMLSDLYSNKKSTSFDDLLNEKQVEKPIELSPRQDYLQNNPKGIYEEINRMTNDKRYSHKEIDKIVERFKKKTGIDIMDGKVPKFDADGNIIPETLPKKITK